jgi:MFS superfamily sulfate permease-like transporter
MVGPVWPRRDLLAGLTTAAVVVPPGGGVRIAGRAAGRDRALRGHRAHGCLRAAGDLAAAQRQLDLDHAGGLLRVGFLAEFISSPVLAGFKAGMGLVIAASQLGKVLGVPVEGGSFFAQVWSALGQLGDANPATVALALTGLAVLLGLRRWAPPCPARWSWSSSGSR